MLYPNIDIAAIGNPGERAVAEALSEQSPANWRIVYSKTWLWRDTRYNKSRFREGEIDFIIIVPGKGFICLEVKSAKQYRLTADGIWQRYDEGEKCWTSYPKSPWEQVTANKHALAGILRERLGKQSLGCGYCAVVVFPRAHQHGQLPAGEDEPALIVNASGMHSLAATLETALAGWWSGEGDTKPIDALLCPDGAVFCDSLAVDIDRQNRKLVRLTEQQSRILHGLRPNKMVQVLGGAGTGKTLLALELAKEATARKQRVLYLCFSRKLASWLAASAGVHSLVATNFHRLARQYAKAAAIEWPDSPSDEFWQQTVSVLFLEAICDLGDKAKFDTVIVDEAQDFLGEWLVPIREMWNEKGQFVLFGDENQAVFGGEIVGHQQLARYVLQDNCRNTRQIAAVCARILRDARVIVDTASIEGLPDGGLPRWVNGGDAGHRRTATIAQVEKWMAQGLMANQIAVLSPWAEGNCLGVGSEDAVVDGVAFTRNLDTWRSGRSCLFETIKSFKGLEADAIVVTDLPVADETAAFSLQDAYVAFSRAKHELVGIASSNAAARLLSRWFAAAQT